MIWKSGFLLCQFAMVQCHSYYTCGAHGATHVDVSNSRQVHNCHFLHYRPPATAFPARCRALGDGFLSVCACDSEAIESFLRVASEFTNTPYTCTCGANG